MISYENKETTSIQSHNSYVIISKAFQWPVFYVV